MRKFFVGIMITAMVLGISLGAQAKDFKVAFADKMKILFEYEKTKDLNKELEDESQKARAEMEKMSDDVKKMSDEMALLSESAKKEKQPELDNKINELNNYRREKMQEISKKQDEGIRQITKEITDVCSKYGKANGYDVIIDVRATLYAPEAMDVTEPILKELNKK